MRNIIIVTAFSFFAFACNRKTGNLTQNISPDDSPAKLQIEAAKMINHFGNSFFDYVYKDGENIIYSPLSISSAMAMLYSGASGETAKEFSNVFRYPNQSYTHKAFKILLDSLATDKNAAVNVAVANALWINQGYSIEKSYRTNLVDYFNAELQEINVENASKIEQSRQKINNWVELKTNENIKNLVPEGVLTDFTRLVLTNAVYFNGPWKYTFDENKTHKDIFYTSDEEAVSTNFMVQTSTYRIAEKKDFTIVELPYKNEAFSFLIIKPKSNGKSLDDIPVSEPLIEMTKELRVERIELHMPKISFSKNIQLNTLLQDMGLTQVFTSDADLSGITGNKELKLDAVLHKAKIDLHEKGTEAAGATAVVIGVKSAPAKPPLVFKANKPFIFYIIHKASGTALFMGSYTHPGES